MTRVERLLTRLGGRGRRRSTIGTRSVHSECPCRQVSSTWTTSGVWYGIAVASERNTFDHVMASAREPRSMSLTCSNTTTCPFLILFPSRLSPLSSRLKPCCRRHVDCPPSLPRAVKTTVYATPRRSSPRSGPTYVGVASFGL